MPQKSASISSCTSNKGIIYFLRVTYNLLLNKTHKIIDELIIYSLKKKFLKSKLYYRLVRKRKNSFSIQIKKTRLIFALEKQK